MGFNELLELGTVDSDTFEEDLSLLQHEIDALAVTLVNKIPETGPPSSVIFKSPHYSGKHYISILDLKG